MSVLPSGRCGGGHDAHSVGKHLAQGGQGITMLGFQGQAVDPAIFLCHPPAGI